MFQTSVYCVVGVVVNVNAQFYNWRPGQSEIFALTVYKLLRSFVFE